MSHLIPAGWGNHLSSTPPIPSKADYGKPLIKDKKDLQSLGDVLELGAGQREREREHVKSLEYFFGEQPTIFGIIYIYTILIFIYIIYIYISIFESPKIEKNTKHHFWRITILVFFNNFSNMEKNSWENHHAKWWDFPAMFDDIYSFWIISCGEFPMSFFLGLQKKQGCLKLKSG